MKDAAAIKLTLDSNLQKVLESLARDRAMALGLNISAGSSWRRPSGRSADALLGRSGRLPPRFQPRRQVDMTRAVRSPWHSTLKPSIYGAAFEDGLHRCG